MSFAYPWVLPIGLVALAAVARAVLRAERSRRTSLAAFGDADVLRRGSALPPPSRTAMAWALRLAALGLGVLALARPQAGERESELVRTGRDVLVLLDLSRSMGVADVSIGAASGEGTRLAAAKQIVWEVVSAHPDDRVGLVIFGGSAFLQMPLTSDRGSLRLFLDAASPDDLGDPATDLSAALLTAVSAFEHEGEEGRRAVLIVTDGESGEGDLGAAGEALGEAELPVFAVGVGSARGGPVPADSSEAPESLHDVCSTIHPMAVASPFFRQLPLAQYGLEWVHTPTLLVHPFDDGSVVTLERTLDATVQCLGADGPAYRALVEPFVERWDDLVHNALRPIRFPEHPFFMARFGLHALRSVDGLVRARFRNDATRAMFAAIAGHCMLPLDWAGTASFGLMLCVTGHAVGWPLARGGSKQIAHALAGHLRELGGVIETAARVNDLRELPRARAVLFDVTPRQLLRIAGDRLPARYRRQLEGYRYGPGAFKIDWALSGPVPWRNARSSESAVLHLAGSYDEVLASERAPWDGVHGHTRPFVLFVQPTLFDRSRAPAGAHVAWAYCHVPNGSTVDMTDAVEQQVERFAPGFRDLIVERHVMPPAALEAHNSNLIGGDINAGAQNLRQLFFRPVPKWNPYTIPDTDLYLCSASTPPGGAVHGMCGHLAANAALRRTFGRRGGG